MMGSRDSDASGCHWLSLGNRELFKVEEFEMPRAGEREAVVEVKAAGINPSDVKNVQGAMHGTTLPRIPGRDFAGSGGGWAGGLDGAGSLGDGWGYWIHERRVACVVYCCCRWRRVPKPAKLSMDAAGSAGLIFVTAWSALVSAVRGCRGGIGCWWSERAAGWGRRRCRLPRRAERRSSGPCEGRRILGAL